MAYIKKSKWFTVTEYGVDLKDSKTHTIRIQAAINAAADAGGGTVLLPPGKYSLNGGASADHTLHIKADNTTLRGAGAALTQIYIPATDVGRTPVYVTGGSPHIFDLSFVHEQPTPAGSGSGWRPNPYKAAVTIERTNNAVLENLEFVNATVAIVALGVGNTTIRNLTGQILGSGITVQDPTGVVNISDVTFGPTWSTDPIVLDYQKANVVAMRGTSIASSDSQLNYTRVSAYNCGHGFIFDGRGPGFSSLTKIFIYQSVNGPCRIGIRTTDPGIRVTVIGYTYVGLQVKDAGGAIRVDNDSPAGVGEGSCSIIAQDLTSFGSEQSAITVFGSAYLLISTGPGTPGQQKASWLQDWAQGANFSSNPAIFLSSASATCEVGDVTFVQSTGSPGFGAPHTGGLGRFVFT